MRGLSAISTVMYAIAFAVLLTSVFDTKWYSIPDTECEEGLYKACCHNVCSVLHDLSREQENAQALVPTMAGLAGLGIVVNSGTAFAEMDYRSVISLRMMIAFAIVIMGAVVTGELYDVHEDRVDANTLDVEGGYYMFIGGWVIVAVDLMFLQMWKLIHKIYGQGITYTFLGRT